MTQDEESKRLHDELLHARKEADRVRLDRAETVNRLTKSLEQSQKQNEELLNSGTAPLTSVYLKRFTVGGGGGKIRAQFGLPKVRSLRIRHPPPPSPSIYVKICLCR